MSAATQDRWLELGDSKLFSRKWLPQDSTSSAIPIILFHDSLGCVELWRDFPEALALATSRPVIAYDRRGYGQSSPNPRLPDRNFIRLAAESEFPNVLDAWGVDQFVAFGHSVGGAMAILAAAHLPTRCRAVVSESTQSFVEEITLEGISRARADFQNPERRKRLEKYHASKTDWVLDAWILTWLESGFADWSLDRDMPRLICPLLAVHGDRDEFGSLQHVERIASRAAILVRKESLVDCGHVPHREKPQVLLPLIADFLSML